MLFRNKKERNYGITAQEMFEKLGYEKVKMEGYNENFLFYKGEVDKVEQLIRFYIPKQDFNLIINSDYQATRVDMRLLQAINQQCIELGWLNG